MKVGLFFGSFNPIHTGHLIIANVMVNTTDLDKAISYNRKSLSIRKNIKIQAPFIAYGNLGYCYYGKT